MQVLFSRVSQVQKKIIPTVVRRKLSQLRRNKQKLFSPTFIYILLPVLFFLFYEGNSI
jgi:hypothetical protein